VEEQFYLVAPLAAWWLARRPKAWKVVALLAAILLEGIALRSFL
jgi:peptidoglycan/LPS O-acetylase OafA/YrhL